MVVIKGHSCKMSYVWVQNKPNNNQNSKTCTSSSPLLIRISSRPTYWLLLLAVCSTLTIFRLGLSPFPTTACVSDRLPGKEIADYRESIPGFYNAIDVAELGEFWKQPDGLGFRTCLNFSDNYRRNASEGRKKRFLIVVVSGGLNQQRNQIVDAVVFARILEATLVIPILQVNLVWGDESEFSDIFDEQQFKETLRDDVHVVSSLPVRHLKTRPISETASMPLQVDEQWIRSRYLSRLNKNGVLLLRGLDSKLTKDLNPDLQKLRCKVAFDALKFRSSIDELGKKIAERMSREGPYLALHLRLEKDVWVRTGCLPGLGHNADRLIERERALHPEFLTARSNVTTAHDRYLAGLCPLNALEVSRLLKGLGASKNTRIYWAGGEPFGGDKALQPLRSEFPHLYNKQSLAKPGELDAIKDKASLLAAIDYIVCLRSQVFMANHGGNMARAMQGHRAFMGHRKHITPNKRVMVQLLLMNKDNGINEREMDEMIKKMHSDSLGSPLLRTDKAGRDVIAYPVPDCMCNDGKLPTNIRGALNCKNN